MATLFQIRRGSGSVSLIDGEIYLHKTSGSLQLGTGLGNPITLANINDINSGSIQLTGDVTATNAYFNENVVITGSLNGININQYTQYFTSSGSQYHIDFNV